MAVGVFTVRYKLGPCNVGCGYLLLDRNWVFVMGGYACFL